MTWSLQVGDASDPELLDAVTIPPGGVEESDGHVRHAALPQHGEEPDLCSGDHHRVLIPQQSGTTRLADACSGIHDLFTKLNVKS